MSASHLWSSRSVIWWAQLTDEERLALEVECLEMGWRLGVMVMVRSGQITEKWELELDWLGASMGVAADEARKFGRELRKLQDDGRL